MCLQSWTRISFRSKWRGTLDRTSATFVGKWRIEKLSIEFLKFPFAIPVMLQWWRCAVRSLGALLHRYVRLNGKRWTCLLRRRISRMQWRVRRNPYRKRMWPDSTSGWMTTALVETEGLLRRKFNYTGASSEINSMRWIVTTNPGIEQSSYKFYWLRLAKDKEETKRDWWAMDQSVLN